MMHLSQTAINFKFLFLSLWILCLLLETDQTKIPKEDKLQEELEEIKSLLLRVDGKLALVESKVGRLNVHDYSSQMKKADDKLKHLDSKVSFMKQMLDELKNSCQGSSTHMSLEGTPSSVEQSYQLDQRNNNDNKVDLHNEVIRKVDDYGKKLISFHQELTEDEKTQKDALTLLLQTVRSGFSKLYDKIDHGAANAASEDQCKKLSVTAQRLLSLIEGLAEQQTNLTSQLREIKAMEQFNRDKNNAKVSRELIQIAKGNMSKYEMLDMIRDLIAPDVPDSLLQALAEGNNAEKTMLYYEMLRNVIDATRKVEFLQRQEYGRTPFTRTPVIRYRYQTEYPNRYQTEYPNRHQTEYPNRYQTEYPNRHQTEYPNRYQTEHPNRYQSEYSNRYPSEYRNRYQTEYPNRYQEIKKIKSSNNKIKKTSTVQ